MIYFAYGSNMSSTVMAERCASARSLGPGKLGGHRLAFTLPSTRWGGFAADLVIDAPSSVWGVLWDVDNEALAVLDGYEARYDRCVIAVSTGPATTKAMTYRVKAENRQRRAGNPAPEYLQHMLDGAAEHGLPLSYVGRLLALSR